MKSRARSTLKHRTYIQGLACVVVLFPGGWGLSSPQEGDGRENRLTDRIESVPKLLPFITGSLRTASLGAGPRAGRLVCEISPSHSNPRCG